MNTDTKNLKEFCKKKHLLYVEDNDETRFYTLEFLSRFFDQISIAKDGIEGIENFIQYPSDFILADINMPKMGGIEMAKYIRNLNNIIPIILLSAHNEEDIYETALNNGIKYYLTKPLDVFQFLTTMKDIMNESENRYAL
ncbi:MAG: response regulator [Sulfuricurvum sp.]|nr:response regulator [Sulfuricurvum sp.]